MNSLVKPPQTSDSDTIVHRELRVFGVVQGVGFRPFVFRLARSNGLAGATWNDSRGVVIRLQGPQRNITEFVRGLEQDLPSAARIDAIDIVDLNLAEYSDFKIRSSVIESEAFTHVSTDLAICNECRAEFLDPNNRRYRYPFINCTQCGPRFSIIGDLPYDRPNTTMARFTMCAECQAEYDDPESRRFHAQPNACPKCGPTLKYLIDSNGAWRNAAWGSDALPAAAELIRNGGILLLQGIGGFHLVCNAMDELAVQELRSRKRRDRKPFAVMFPDIECVQSFCELSDRERESLESSRAPIVVLNRLPECTMGASICPDHPSIGAMLPYSPLHIELMTLVDTPVIMTSANISGEPIFYNFDSARFRLYGVADAALVHDRDIRMFADDSVVKVVNDLPMVWRRSRGYAPESIRFPMSFKKTTLGVGAGLKNTFAIGKSDSIMLSQHLGDIESTDGVEAARKALDHYLHLFDAQIESVACDLHPDYESTRFAEAWSRARGLPLTRVQHHHAHLAACLAEHHLNGSAIGIICDGTGYGTDATICGGELLFGDCRSFSRLGHLQLVPLLGVDAAARQPWRMALAWLNEIYGNDLGALDLPLLLEIDLKYGPSARSTLLGASRATSFPMTSSLGRLFDAVAALAGFGVREQFEGQAAMWLEGIASPYPEVGYTIELVEEDNHILLSPVPMFRRIVTDLLSGTPAAIISRRFHEGLVTVWACAAERAASLTSCDRIVLSGGCFQNRLLLERTTCELKQRKLIPIVPVNVPMNDGGISLGQVVISNAQVS